MSTHRSPSRRRHHIVPLLIAFALVLAACTPGGGGTATQSGGSGDGSGGSAAGTLRVLAGSELQDMKPILAKAKASTGVDVQLTYAGTLDASSRVASGAADSAFDAVWISSNRYLSMDGAAGKVATSTKIMSSPVVLGVRAPVARQLGWSAAKPPSWSEISQAVAAKKFHYAMTNPAASNSGFSTLVAVASALTGGGTALDSKRVDQAMPAMKTFFSGQKLTAGSTGWLTDKFVKDTSVDGMFSYESTLLTLNKAGTLAEPLVIITPSDGVISGDYPLSLLKSANASQRAAYDKVVAWLRTPAAQTEIMKTTWRRPMIGGVTLDPALTAAQRVELPFPAGRAVADELIGGYLNKARRPPTTIYVLDTSGSMEGERIEALKKAMLSLASPSGNQFQTFVDREDITLLPFNTTVGPAQDFLVTTDNRDAVLGGVRTSINRLQAGGQTHLFEAMETAYDIAETKTAKNPDSYVSVVVMTDGAATGVAADSFLQTFDAKPAAVKAIPTFAILFGDSNKAQLEQIAATTGGRVFDGRADLAEAFRTIRDYQ